MNFHFTQQAPQFVHVRSPLISLPPCIVFPQGFSKLLSSMSKCIAILFPLSKPDNSEFFMMTKEVQILSVA